MGNLTLTPKGEKYIRNLELKNPEVRQLRERMAEALKTMPRTRKGLMEACYAAAARDSEREREEREARERTKKL